MREFLANFCAIENEFFAEVENSGYTYDEDSYEVTIGNGVLRLRIECFDENEDTVVITQEIETEDNELISLGIRYHY